MNIFHMETNEQVAIKFLNWVWAQNYIRYTDSIENVFWIKEEDSFKEYTSEQLYQLFLDDVKLKH